MHLAAVSPMLNEVALIFGIGLAAGLFLICLSVAAVILKMACRTAGVEPPDTGRAMAVSFLETLIGGGVYLATMLTVGVVGTLANMDRGTLTALVGFSALGVAVIVPAGVYVPMLQVTFSKGLAISLLRYAITLSLMALIIVGTAAATGKVRYL
jgi:hypothetical protein